MDFCACVVSIARMKSWYPSLASGEDSVPRAAYGANGCSSDRPHYYSGAGAPMGDFTADSAALLVAHPHLLTPVLQVDLSPEN